VAPVADPPSGEAGPAEPARPRHIAIIMDGNNRWLKQRGGKGLDGHRAGVKAARRAMSLCAERGVEVLTLFAFSSENWQRPRQEVSGLLSLFSHFLQRSEIVQLHENNVRLRFIGNRSRFHKKLQTAMLKAEELTMGNTGLQVVVAADYGGRWDIANAARLLATEVADGKREADSIDEQVFHQYTSISDLPPPDICIRTGGEFRISNFLLWQFAYTELYFTHTYWPDFDAIELDAALADFARRQRRYGRISEQVDQDKAGK
jgi:undecaprenyl diphosphate synthase